MKDINKEVYIKRKDGLSNELERMHKKNKTGNFGKIETIPGLEIALFERKDDHNILEFFGSFYAINRAEDQDLAKQICLRLCEKGNIVAEAYTYSMGWNQQILPRKAFNLFSQYINENLNKKGTGREPFEVSVCLGYCYNMIGFMYEKGIISERIGSGFENSLKYYKLGKKLNNPIALNNLASMYENGIGVEKNLYKTVKYYTKASELGSSLACNNLAGLVEVGDHCKMDVGRAIELYEKAASFLNQTAINNIAQIYEEGVIIPRDMKKSLEYYEMCAGLGNFDAMVRLSELYNEGKKVCGDPDKVADYYFMITNSQKIENSDRTLYRKKLGLLISGRMVTWNPIHRDFWTFPPGFWERACTFLLISKHKRECSLEYKSVLINGVLGKGIAMIVIRYLIHFEQCPHTTYVCTKKATKKAVEKILKK